MTNALNKEFSKELREFPFTKLMVNEGDMIFDSAKFYEWFDSAIDTGDLSKMIGAVKSIKTLKSLHFVKKDLGSGQGKIIVNASQLKDWIQDNFLENLMILNDLRKTIKNAKRKSFVGRKNIKQTLFHKEKDIERIPFYIGQIEKGNAVVDSTEFNNWLKEVVAKRSLTSEDISILEDGKKEISDNKVATIDGNSTPEFVESAFKVGSTEDINIISVNDGNKIIYWTNSFEKLFDVKNSKENPFYDFLGDLLDNSSENHFCHFILSESENDNKSVQNPSLKPCSYIYKDKIKLLCLIDNSTNRIYFVGYSLISSLDPGEYLSEAIGEYTLNKNDIKIFNYPIIFGKEISFNDAESILGYTRKKMEKLVRAKEIFSRYPITDQKEEELDQLPIPVKELLAHINDPNTAIDNKEDRVNILCDYVTEANTAIFNKMSNTMPYPVKNQDLQVLRKENEKLRKKNEKLEKQFKAKNNKNFIRVATKLIVKLIKGPNVQISVPEFLESFKEEGPKLLQTQIDENLIEIAKYKNRKGFRYSNERARHKKELEEWSECQKQIADGKGKDIATIIFKSLEKGEYRRDRGRINSIY